MKSSHQFVVAQGLANPHNQFSSGFSDFFLPATLWIGEGTVSVVLFITMIQIKSNAHSTMAELWPLITEKFAFVNRDCLCSNCLQKRTPGFVFVIDTFSSPPLALLARPQAFDFLEGI